MMQLNQLVLLQNLQVCVFKRCSYLLSVKELPELGRPNPFFDTIPKSPQIPPEVLGTVIVHLQR